MTPIFTEKSLKLAKQGKYSFWVDKNANKLFIKSAVAKAFGVHVTDIKTISVKGETKRNAKGKKSRLTGGKKAIVSLKEGEKIDIFEEKK